MTTASRRSGCQREKESPSDAAGSFGHDDDDDEVGGVADCMNCVAMSIQSYGLGDS